ncbi:hypothetical protein [Pedobacter borealis]|uniref:hypothetical protein n=1 Tax=Pedobacter borealis TaxID=475254 RepID=UPI000B0F21B9|nr:hypothetical protein [Pedobacter borealis]
MRIGLGSPSFRSYLFVVVSRMLLVAATKRIAATIRFISLGPVAQNHGQLCIGFPAD